MNINIGTIIVTSTVSSIAVGSCITYLAKKFFENELELRIAKFNAVEEQLNIESQSYVNIITKQRIEWLEVVRKDFAKVIGLYSIVKYHNNYENTIGWGQLFSAWSSNESFKEFLKDNDFAVKNFVSSVGKKEHEIAKLVETITVLRLRMNPNDDSELIELLKKLENVIIARVDKADIESIIKKLEKDLQKMLKAEWQRVKEEIEYRGNVKETS